MKVISVKFDSFQSQIRVFYVYFFKFKSKTYHLSKTYYSFLKNIYIYMSTKKFQTTFRENLLVFNKNVKYKIFYFFGKLYILRLSN